MTTAPVRARVCPPPAIVWRVSVRDDYHLSIFPFSSRAVDAVRDQLAGVELSKGTVRFTVAAPIPTETVRDLVRHRAAEIRASTW